MKKKKVNVVKISDDAYTALKEISKASFNAPLSKIASDAIIEYWKKWKRRK